MNEPRFLITGSGRSGTGYIAALLQKCGLNVGHEAWWTLHQQPQPGLDGDCSWLGCFDDGYRGLVYAQVRDPRTTIPSIFGRENTHPWSILRHATVPHSGDWAIDAARIWLGYTRHAVDRAEAFWRVEDVDEATLGLFDVDPATAGDALAVVPRDTNAGERQTYPWPDHPVIREALDFGRLLGYPA